MTAVALYVVQLADPVDRLISWLDEIQVGATSFARLVGIARVPPDRDGDRRRRPTDERLRARGRALRVRRRAATCCTASTSTSSPASASPSSARPAPASRRSAACSPASTRRGAGRVDVGGVRLVDLPLETLRKEVALVTQEQHVFVGTLAENLQPRAARTRPTTQLASALARGRRARVGRRAARRAARRSSAPAATR